MTNANPPPATPTRPLAEGHRQVLQGLLGEHHGLLTTIIQELLLPPPNPLASSDPEMQEIFQDLWNAFPRVSVAFGEVQGALNSLNGLAAIVGPLIGTTLLATFGSSKTVHEVRMVFGGWVIGWLSATIARASYPPPTRRLFGGRPATSPR